MVFSLPAITFSPATAVIQASFALVSAPSFLSLQQTGNTAQGVISANPGLGTFNYQVTVTDAISLLTHSLNATLVIY